MAENKAEFKINLIGDVVTKARAFSSAISGMGASGSRSMRVLGAAANGANRVIDKFDNKLTGFVTGGALVAMAKRVGEQSTTLEQLATRYNLSADAAQNLNNQMWSIATQYNTPYSGLIDGVDEFLSKTNDINALNEHFDNLALTVRGFGVDTKTAGAIVGNFFNYGYRDAKSMRDMLNTIASASTVGAGDLVTQLNGLMSVINATQWQSPEQIKQMLTMQRLSDAAFDSSAQSAAALQGFYNVATDRDKLRALARNGLDVFNGDGRVKDPTALALEIGNRAKFNAMSLKGVFGDDTVKLLKSFAEKQEELKRGFSVNDGFISDKVARNINTFGGAMTSLTNAGERWAQLRLAKPIQDLSDAINSLTPEELEEYSKKIETVAIGIGSVIAARYAYRGVKSVIDIFGNKSKLPGTGGGGGITGAASGVVPVYVTNWQNGGGSSLSGDAFSYKSNNVLRALPMIWELERARSEFVSGGGLDKFLAAQAERDKQLTPYFESKGLEGIKYHSLPPSLDAWLQKRAIKTAEEQENPKSKAELQNDFMRMYGIYPSTANSIQQQSDSGKLDVNGEITIKIDAAPGVDVKSTQTQSNIKMNVETGKTYRGAY